MPIQAAVYSHRKALEIALPKLRTCHSIEFGGGISQIRVSPGGDGRRCSDIAAEISPGWLGKTGFGQNAISSAGLAVPHQLDSICQPGSGDTDWRRSCRYRGIDENSLARVVVGAARGSLQSNGSD